MKDVETNYQKELVTNWDSETQRELQRLKAQRLEAKHLKAQREQLQLLEAETLSGSEYSRYTNEHSDIQDGLGTGGNFDIYTRVSTTERESRKYDV